MGSLLLPLESVCSQRSKLARGGWGSGLERLVPKVLPLALVKVTWEARLWSWLHFPSILCLWCLSEVTQHYKLSSDLPSNLCMLTISLNATTGNHLCPVFPSLPPFFPLSSAPCPPKKSLCLLLSGLGMHVQLVCIRSSLRAWAVVWKQEFLILPLNFFVKSDVFCFHFFCHCYWLICPQVKWTFVAMHQSNISKAVA